MNVGKESCGLLPGCTLGGRADLVPCGRDNFFLALGDILLLITLTFPATRDLALTEVFFKRLGLSKVDVSTDGIAGIARTYVIGHDIARHQVEILEIQQCISFDILCALGKGERLLLFLATIHGVVQRHRFQAVVVLCQDGDAEFFNRGDARVLAGTCDAEHGRRLRANTDEVILSHTDEAVGFFACNVIGGTLGLLIEGEGGAGGAAVSLKLELGSVVKHDQTVGQGQVCIHDNGGLCAAHSLHVSQILLDRSRNGHPLRVLIFNAQLLDLR